MIRYSWFFLRTYIYEINCSKKNVLQDFKVAPGVQDVYIIYCPYIYIVFRDLYTSFLYFIHYNKMHNLPETFAGKRFLLGGVLVVSVLTNRLGVVGRGGRTGPSGMGAGASLLSHCWSLHTASSTS